MLKYTANLFIVNEAGKYESERTAPRRCYIEVTYDLGKVQARNSKRSDGFARCWRRVSLREQTRQESTHTHADYISYQMLFTWEYRYLAGQKIVMNINVATI